MLEHPNSASGTGSKPNSPGIRARSSRRRRAVAVIAGALICTAVAAFLVTRSSWWTGPATRPGAGPPPREGPLAGATMPEPSTSPARPEAAGPTAESIRQEAFAVIRQLMEELPDDPGAMCLMAKVHMHFSETAEAQKWCWKCLERDPRHAPAYHTLALLASMKGDRQKALDLWRKAQEINPDLPGVYGAPAEVLLEMGKPQEAIAALEKEIQRSPGRGKYYLLLGQAHFQQNEYGKAAANYQKAVKCSPQASRPNYGLACAWARLGAADKAREYTQKFQALRHQEEQTGMALRRAADDRSTPRTILAEAHTEAGRLYAVHQRLKEAQEHWRRAASLDPRNAPCRESLADLCRIGGRLAEALEFSEQLRQTYPGMAAYHFRTGTLLAELQRLDAAEEAFRKALELAPAQPPVYHGLVRLLLARSQKLPEAKALAQRLVELEPTAANWRLLAEACRRGGDMDGARQAVRRALDFETPGAKTPEGRTPPGHQK